LLVFAPIQQPFGRAVDEGHAPSASSPTTPEVTEDSTESNSRRRRSIWRVFSSKRVALALQLPGHLVEIPAQHRDLVIAPLLAHLHVQIARAHALRGPGQPPHRARQPLGEPQPSQIAARIRITANPDKAGRTRTARARARFPAACRSRTVSCVSSSSARISPSTSRLT
jgi:hypothetical protein